MVGRRARVVVCAYLAALCAAVTGCGGASSAAPPRSVADQLIQTDGALRSAIDGWRAGGDPPSSAPPQEVLDQAKAVQDDARYLAEHSNLNARVMPLLPAALAAETRRLTTAEQDLLRLSRGAGHRKLKVGAPPPLSDLVSFYREAQARYGVGWNYLAAIHLVETKFGRVKSNSVAGAQGPMQFIPSTWRIYGNGGDIQDPHDAILAAANLLAANGGRTNERRALAHYNRSPLYWDAVLHLAHRMAAVPTAFREYYAWKLYLRKH
jgi:membrane-bound lytic murein transglycosylase B